MKYVQGNITNELIKRSFKIKGVYNKFKNHTSMVIKGSLGHFCSSGRQMQEIALAG